MVEGEHEEKVTKYANQLADQVTKAMGA
jgi:hypothetical protein